METREKIYFEVFVCWSLQLNVVLIRLFVPFPLQLEFVFRQAFEVAAFRGPFRPLLPRKLLPCYYRSLSGHSGYVVSTSFQCLLDCFVERYDVDILYRQLRTEQISFSDLNQIQFECTA